MHSLRRKVLFIILFFALKNSLPSYVFHHVAPPRLAEFRVDTLERVASDAARRCEAKMKLVNLPGDHLQYWLWLSKARKGQHLELTCNELDREA